MTVIEDLRGRDFGWQALGETSQEWAIVEDPVEVGRLSQVADQKPTFFGDFAGGRFRLEHSVGVLGPTFEVFDANTSTLLLKSFYTREAELRAQIGDRYYSLRRADGFAVWNDGTEDAVSLRPGKAFVLMGADPSDAAPLLLLGIVMSIENTLFARK